MDNIIIVAHKYLPQPDDDLVKYLNLKKKNNVLHIYHSFNDAKNRSSYVVWYKKGIIYKKYQSRDYRKYPEALIYIKELIFTTRMILNSKQKWNMYIGVDGLCVLFGNIVRLMNKINKIIYWTIDFVPNGRFNSEIKNRIYYLINRFSYLRSDEVWDLSPKMSDIRRIHYKVMDNEKKVVKIVPYGLWLDRIKKYPYAKCNKNTLVFMGHLIEKQGVQLVLRCMPAIIKRNKLFRFKIIGEGNYARELHKIAGKYKIDKYCNFKGKISDNEIMEKEIAKSCLAIAPYIKRLDKWTKYADPGKVKTYLGCGVPVLLTDLPWNAGEIQKTGCGKIITEDKDSIIENVIKFMRKDINGKCRVSAIKYSQKYNWINIFSDLFN